MPISDHLPAPSNKVEENIREALVWMEQNCSRCQELKPKQLESSMPVHLFDILGSCSYDWTVPPCYLKKG